MEPDVPVRTPSGSSESITRIPRVLDREWIADSGLLQARSSSTVVLDFSETERIDSAGISVVRMLHGAFEKAGGRLVLRNLSPSMLSLLTSWAPVSSGGPVSKKPPGLFERAGDGALGFAHTATEALSVMAEMLYWGTVGALRRRDFRKGSLGQQMYELGYRAFGIVGLLSLLIGIVLALQTAIQLRVYGAGVFLAPLIGITMVREMGPLLTAIILAGRTGSATTAEIATMGVGEEIDALKTMGINPIQFVVVPKLWAITLTMPLLSIMATAAGILGGFLIAVFYLELAPSLFWGELAKSIAFNDFMAGFVKSVVFSWLIIWIGSFYGLRVRGGAEAVGRETTASVVTGIFIIILADALFSFVL